MHSFAKNVEDALRNISNKLYETNHTVSTTYNRDRFISLIDSMQSSDYASPSPIFITKSMAKWIWDDGRPLVQYDIKDFNESLLGLSQAFEKFKEVTDETVDIEINPASDEQVLNLLEN